jgi:hypothetical protein
MPASIPPPARTTILDSEYFRIEVDSRGGILWMRRTATPMTTLADTVTAQTEVIDRLNLLARRHLALLVDLREAPSRNDPEFELAVKQFRQELFALFQRGAVLVRTQAGKMQLVRHIRSDGGGAKIFDDEWAALEYLRQK